MNFYYFIGLIILLIIIYLLRYNTVEKFDIQYHDVVGNLFQDYRFQKYNQNSNQTWKELPMHLMRRLSKHMGPALMICIK